MHDYFRHEFDHDRAPDSVADITKGGPDYTLSFLVRPQFDDFFAEVERLPEAKLAVDRTRLGNTPLFYEGESSVGQYHNIPGDTNVVGTGETRTLWARRYGRTRFIKLWCRRWWAAGCPWFRAQACAATTIRVHPIPRRTRRT